MKAVSETKPKLETVPSLTDSDCSSGESDREASESDESQDEDVESDIEKAEDDDETFMSDTEDSSTSSSQSFGKSQSAEELKEAGNKAFKASKYREAIDFYEKAINANKISQEDKAKCYGNMSHCYLLWQSKYKEALEAGRKSIECSINKENCCYPRAFQRCAAAHVKLNQPGLAALTLKKGLAWSVKKCDIDQLESDYKSVELRGRTEAEDWLHEFHSGNAKRIDLEWAAENGFKKKPKKGPTKVKPAKTKTSKKSEAVSQDGLPLLIESNNEDSSESEAEDSDSFPEGVPNPTPNSPKRKKMCNEDPGVPQKVEPTGIRNPTPAAAPVKKTDGQTFKPGFLVHSNNDTVKKVVPEKKTDPPPAPQPPRPVEPKPQPEVVKQKEPERDVFMRAAREGTSCYKESIFQGAKDKFGECLSLIDSSYKALNFNQPMKKSSEVVVIKFMYARACTGQHTYKDIISGYDKFNEILNLHKEVKFPAVYLGLALMFQKLNRYEQALINAEKGVEWFDNNLPCLTYSYPGSNADPIAETKKDYLKDFFVKLKSELKCPPRPDAVCKYPDCLKVIQDNHIIPSQKIFKSDPNFKPFYRVYCTDSCILDFHDCCWSSLKSDISKAKGSKAPTEKDFCGQVCCKHFTPDCEGIIIKIEIVDVMEIFRTIEDPKLNEKLEQEERRRKEAEKEKKAEELKKHQLQKLEARAKNPKKKERSRSKSVVSDNTESSELKSDEDSKPNNDNNNDNEKINRYESIPDLTKVPVAILRKKENDNDDDNLDNKKKEKKKKEKATLSLGEFVGTMELKGNDEHTNRIGKLAAMKESNENYSPGAFMDSGYDKNLNPNARSFNPVPSFSNNKISSRNTVEESVKTYIYEQLSKHGPMKDSDSRLTKDMDTKARQLISDGNGLLHFLKSDERFGSYSNYLCIKGDAEKAKKLKDEDDKNKELKESTSTMNGSLGATARKLKEQIEKEKTPSENKEDGFGLKIVSEEPSLLESIQKQSMETSSKRPTLGAGPSFRNEGVQTDVSSLNVDADDPYVLQQNNELLAEELQTVNDKLAVLQKKSKLEQREQSTQIANLESERLVLQLKVQDLENTIKQREHMFKEASKTQKELRSIKDSFDASSKKNVNLERELKEVKKNLEDEQKVSFNLQQKVNKIREKDDTIRILKLKCLKSDFERKKDCLIQKKQDNELLIANLLRMSNAESNHASSAAIRPTMEKLNAFSASLYSALETLRVRYEERKQGIETAPTFNHHTEVNFEVSSIRSPDLDSLELDTLRLLAMANFNTNVRPSQVTPFSQPPPQAQPPSRPPPQSRHQPQGQPRGPPGLRGTAASLRPPPSSSPSASLNSSPGRKTLPSFHQGSLTGDTVNPPPQLASNSAPAVISPPSRAQFISPPSSSPVPRVQGTSGAHAGASFNQPPTSSGDVKKNKNNEMLQQKILARNPHLTAEEADSLIQGVRKSNGKLSGLSIQTIIQCAEKLMKEGGGGVRREAPEECSICFESLLPGDPNVRRLPCNHRFHHDCINGWLASANGAGNTCPLCREYIVAEDQFPGLGQRSRRRNQ